MLRYDSFKNWCRGFGFEITNEDETVLGTKTFLAVGNNMSVLAGENGTVRIIKPNGSVKWYYETTNGKITSTIKKIVEFYK